MAKPYGVCIQPLETKIQKVETGAPGVTIQAVEKCSADGTLLQPNSIAPRNLASRKETVSTSYSGSGSVMLPTN